MMHQLGVKHPVHFISKVEVNRGLSLDAIHVALKFCWVSQTPKEKTASMLLLWMNNCCCYQLLMFYIAAVHGIKFIESRTWRHCGFIKWKQKSNQFKMRSFNNFYCFYYTILLCRTKKYQAKFYSLIYDDNSTQTRTSRNGN